MVHPNSLANLRPPWSQDNPPEAKGPRMPPVTSALRKLFDIADESGETNAVKFAKHAVEQAVSGRRDAVLWAKMILERVDGPVRREIELSLGMPELMRDAHERWLRKRATTVEPDK